MTTHLLPFGHVDWPADRPRPIRRPRMPREARR